MHTGENTFISEHNWLSQQVYHSPSKQILAFFLKIYQTISFCALSPLIHAVDKELLRKSFYERELYWIKIPKGI
jgi:hypothetical protein